MDAERFDRLVVAFGRRIPRRSVLGLLASLGLTGLVTRDVVGQGCLANGSRCGRASDPACCSGLCKRKRGSRKKSCRSTPGQSICIQGFQACPGTQHACDASAAFTCTCWLTIEGFMFCGASADSPCFPCVTHADCENRPNGGQAGDRCVQCTSCGSTVNNRACVHACPNPA